MDLSETSNATGKTPVEPVSIAIFVCYRPEDSQQASELIYDRLAQRFGERHVFTGVDAIPFGADFVEFIDERVGQCDAFIAVIGKHWLDKDSLAKDGEGRRRIDNPVDVVRLEIAAALRRRIRVIPVLVDGAGMPSRGELPTEIRTLTMRNGLEMRHERFNADVSRLLDELAQIAQEPPKRRSATPTIPPDAPAPDPSQFTPTPARVTRMGVTPTLPRVRSRGSETTPKPPSTRPIGVERTPTPARAIPATEKPTPLAEAALEAPIIEAPAVVPPIIEAPAVVPPIIETPIIEAPIIEAPAVVPPIIEAPAVVPPIIEAPAVVPPIIEVPIIDAPAVVRSAVDALTKEAAPEPLLAMPIEAIDSPLPPVVCSTATPSADPPPMPEIAAQPIEVTATPPPTVAGATPPPTAAAPPASSLAPVTATAPPEATKAETAPPLVADPHKANKAVFSVPAPRTAWTAVASGLLVGGIAVTLLSVGGSKSKSATQTAIARSVPAPASVDVAATPQTKPLSERFNRPEIGAMTPIPAGSFTQGSNDGEADERPKHGVDVAAFEMDLTEVTVKAYQACVNAGHCEARSTVLGDWYKGRGGVDSWSKACNFGKTDRDDHPMNCVDWSDAEKYCTWAGKRLPTEEEWEYAARGGESRKFPWGTDAPDAQHLNACGPECINWLNQHVGKQLNSKLPQRDPWPTTAPVGSMSPGDSPFGLHDMAGNVWEWTASWYCAYDQPGCNGSMRSYRGGSWTDDASSYLRSAFRNYALPTFRANNLGFRCARQ